MNIIDLTLRVTPKDVGDAKENLKKAWGGHLGTHYDVMNKEFPLEYMELPAVAFDVENKGLDEIRVSDIDLSEVEEYGAVAFCSRFIEKVKYGTKEYFARHPQLSRELIDALLDKHVRIIVVDFSGLRNGTEHTPTDQYCADHGTFIVENACNLSAILAGRMSARFTLGTYPVNFAGMTGLPCRVVARI